MRDKSFRISRRLFMEKSVCGAALAGTAMLPAWAPLNPIAADAELLHNVRGKVSEASARGRRRKIKRRIRQVEWRVWKQ